MELSLIIIIIIVIAGLFYFLGKIDKALTLWAASLVGSKNRIVGGAIIWAFIIIVGILFLGG